MLVIVNPYATTVSDRLRNLVVYALQSRYSVEAIDTEKRDHATQICREAAREGYDVVVAFGGDGTVNEAANGLVGSETPLTALPGGSTNVWCRTLGIPNDVVDATEHLLRMADEFEPRRGRPRAASTSATSCSPPGSGSTRRGRARGRATRCARRAAAPGTTPTRRSTRFTRRYLVRPAARARARRRHGARGRDGDRPELRSVHLLPQRARSGWRRARASTSGSLSAGRAASSATPLELPTLVPRLLSGRAATVLRHRQVESLGELAALRVEAIDERPFPVQVDGDYIGEFAEIEFSVVPGGLLAVS